MTGNDRESVRKAARRGVITDPIRRVAGSEGKAAEQLLADIAEGSVVIMRRGDSALGIGKGLRTKVNVNIGSAPGLVSMKDEVEKAKVAEQFGADTVSDLSMGGDLRRIRKVIFRHTTAPVTTVPIYQTAAERGIGRMTKRDILSTVREQAAAGVSSMVLHGVSSTILDQMKRQNRILGVVSKGGSITSAYMHLNGCENPYVEMMDEILDVFRKHDIVLSLGNTARGGCIHDEWDMASRQELEENIALARHAFDQGVQVIIEGAGGHIRLDRIARSVREYKRASPFPLFVAGPLPTDIAVGYDHLAGCVGASAASAAGADYLCAITPSEHLGLPGPEQVKEGLIAFKIAAHIGDIVKNGCDLPDRELAVKRSRFDREGQFASAMDEARARRLARGQETCSMCGDFCAIRLMREILGDGAGNYS